MLHACKHFSNSFLVWLLVIFQVWNFINIIVITITNWYCKSIWSVTNWFLSKYRHTKLITFTYKLTRFINTAYYGTQHKFIIHKNLTHSKMHTTFHYSLAQSLFWSGCFKEMLSIFINHCSKCAPAAQADNFSLGISTFFFT